LHIGPSFRAAWENVLLPWFESVSATAVANKEPVAVVTPFYSQASFLRALLLERRISLLAVKFFSPAQLRELLLRGVPATIPLREHLRLLLSIAAEECSEHASPADNKQNAIDLSTIAKSVARAPDHLLRAIDQLSGAGWSFEDAGPAALREITANFHDLAKKCEFQMVHRVDRAAVKAADKNPPRFSNLLITGFNSMHWPLWPLLRAAAASAIKATVVLSDPRDEARDLDETWVGTWEETFSAAQPIAAHTERSTSSLAELARVPQTPSELKERAAHPIANVRFFVGRNTTEQAQAIVALTGQFLSEKRCERIGILFSGPGGLHRLVAALLEEMKIPHGDGVGHAAPHPLDCSAWRGWLELQENPRLNILLRFLRAFENDGLFSALSIHDVEKTLRRAYDDVLIDDIHVLREYCARRVDDKISASVADRLSALPFLPERGTMSVFLSQSRKIFEQFGWRERWSEVARLSRNWSGAISAPVSRRAYLRWLTEIISPPAIGRDESGNHPYSRVQLQPYAAAEGQDWSHLIFAGLNDGEWPPLNDESGFIRDEEIVDLNRRVRQLNRRAIRQGRHGEGQWSVEEGKTLYLGAAEQREIARRQFFNLIESAAEKIGVTANLLQDSAPERTWNPSDFFSRLYFATRGKAVSQEVMHALEAKTRAWLSESKMFPEKDKGDSIDTAQTRVSYDARRQSGVSGQYEFALRKPPERAVSLRVTDWEKALKTPALIWMKTFLGVEADEWGGDAWSRSTGQWIHRWLAQSAAASDRNQFVELPPANVMRARIIEAAQQFRSEMRRLCEASGRALPDWWSSGWSNALYVADCLAAHLSGLEDWSHLATEWQLASPEIISLGDNKELRVRGRIDLILARDQAKASPLGFAELWVIDYKTGRQRGFDLREFRTGETCEEQFQKKLARGEAVQLGLYALAARQLGGSNIQLTLLTPAGDLEPQFRIEDVVAHKSFWRELHRMQETGVFGMLGPIRPLYGFAPKYPLATLAVDLDFLKEKWVATHPALAVAENGGIER